MSMLESVPLEEAKEQVAKVCSRLALLHLAFAETLVEELGEEKGTQLVLKAIKRYGMDIGNQAKERAREFGLDNKPENYKEDLPFYGMHESTENIVVGGIIRTRAYGCVMGKLWKKLNKDKLGRLYCYVDVAKYMAFNSNYKMVHLKSLPDGDEYCEFCVLPTTNEDKRNFDDNNKGWRYIDRP